MTHNALSTPADPQQEIAALKESYRLQSEQLKATEKRLKDAEFTLAIIGDKADDLQNLCTSIKRILNNPSTQ